jgi:hypothetical protein
MQKFPVVGTRVDVRIAGKDELVSVMVQLHFLICGLVANIDCVAIVGKRAIFGR